MLRFKFLLLPTLLLLFPCLLIGQPLKRGIFITFDQDDFPNSFEGHTWAFMQAASEDLGLQVKLYKINGNRFSFLTHVEQELNKAEKLDFVVIGAMSAEAALPILERLEAAKVQSYFFNSAIRKDEQAAIGKPRGKFSQWLGHMIPDDEEAGYRLAQTLISRAKAKGLTGKNGTLSIIAHTGDRLSSPSRLRAQGLKRALKEHPECKLEQLMWSSWKQELTYQRTLDLAERYPDIQIVWTASAQMAIGAIKGLAKVGLKPGQQVLVGGMDFEAKALEEIHKGRLEVVLGGHFMEGGWVMVLLADYYRGQDFADLGVERLTPLYSLTKDNLEQVRPFLEPQTWSGIDFNQFTRSNHTKGNDYRFGLEGVTKAYSKNPPQTGR